MLVLTRKAEEAVTITDGSVTITVKIVELKAGRVRLGIDAPDKFQIARSEILDKKTTEQIS